MLGNRASKKHYRVGGTRGGQDQFKWDDVKADKYRENYLGNSLLAPVGRWQQGKDILWYTRDKSAQNDDIALERERARQQDEDLILETIGVKAKKVDHSSNHTLNNEELKKLLARGGSERGGLDTERVEGLGAAPTRVHDHIERISSIQKEINKLKSGQNEESGQLAPNMIVPSEKRKRDSSDSDSESSSSEKKQKKHKHKKDKHKKQKDSKRDKDSRRHDSDRDRDRDGDRDRDRDRDRDDRSKREKDRRQDSRDRRNPDRERERDRDRERDRERDRDRSRSRDRRKERSRSRDRGKR